MDQEQDIVITNSRITEGSHILTFFANKNLITRFMSRYHDSYNEDDGIVIASISRVWLHQIYLCHSDTLMSQEPTKIRKLSELIWRNTLTPLEVDKNTSAVEWAKLGSGLGLRWEVLGLIGLSIGMFVMETHDSDQIYVENRVSRSCVLGRMQEIAEKCLVFCRYCEVLEDSFIWLLLEYSTLIQATKGDRHYSSYRASGEACSAVIAMGLHQTIKPTEKVPFFLAELRKRAFLCAYYGEISLATCLGRPPRLSYRYCSIDPPLDLTQAQLTQTGEELASTLASLDEDGYNRLGTIQSNTSKQTRIDLLSRSQACPSLPLKFD